MGVISSIFGKLKQPNMSKVTTWNELGVYRAIFSSFGGDIYKSDVVRSCVRPLAEHSSKANCKCTDKRIENILNYRPNMYMNGKDFISKVRNWLEIKNTAMIYIDRDDRGKACGFYPVPYAYYEAVEYNGRLYIKFSFAGNAQRVLTVAWDDLAVLRKDYNSSDISGDSNSSILTSLELINTANQGLSNAVKSTSNLRGILKNTKGVLDPDDIKAQKDRFVKDYMGISNEGGIASLDSTQEFIPISMNPKVADAEQMKEFRENIYRYFGVSDAIITSNFTESQLEGFYEARIEPFLVALSLELTSKVFTDRELGFGNKIVYESNRIQYTSTKTKLSMVQMVDRGALTPNEWRQVFNLAPIEGGDEPIRRLDTEVVNEHNETTNEEEGENDG